MTDDSGVKKTKENIESLSDLYMINRREMLESSTSFNLYNRLMESISIGDALLGEGHTYSDKVNSLLSDSENYPKSRDMDYKSTQKMYTCSAGDGNTGRINVRPEELEIGENSLINQQCNSIIRKIKPIDRNLFMLIVKKGLVKRMTLKEAIEKDIGNDLLEDLNES